MSAGAALSDLKDKIRWESALSGYTPKLEELSKIQVDELAAVKAKERTLGGASSP